MIPLLWLRLQHLTCIAQSVLHFRVRKLANLSYIGFIESVEYAAMQRFRQKDTKNIRNYYLQLGTELHRGEYIHVAFQWN